MVRTIRINEEDFSGFFSRFEEDSKCVKVNADFARQYYENLVSSGLGQIFLLYDEDGAVHGGLGCVRGPVPHSGEWMAVELFWYVAPEYRGALGAIELINAFHQWAKDVGCKYCAMIHLMDSQPERLEKLYGRLGYRLVEKHYVKEVS